MNIHSHTVDSVQHGGSYLLPKYGRNGGLPVLQIKTQKKYKQTNNKKLSLTIGKLEYQKKLLMVLQPYKATSLCLRSEALSIVFFCFICMQRKSNLGDMLNIGKRLKRIFGALHIFPLVSIKRGRRSWETTQPLAPTSSIIKIRKNKGTREWVGKCCKKTMLQFYLHITQS